MILTDLATNSFCNACGGVRFVKIASSLLLFGAILVLGVGFGLGYVTAPHVVASPTLQPTALPTVGSSVVPSAVPPVRLGKNPLVGVDLFVDPESPAQQQADAWRQSRPEDAALLDKIAAHPQATWFSGHEAQPDLSAENLALRAEAQNQVPLIVVYALPKRDCGGAAAGGKSGNQAYLEYVRDIASGLQGHRAVVVLEPDGTASIRCLSPNEVVERRELLQHAIRTFKAGGHVVYVDAANPRWVGLEEMSRRLNLLNLSEADGFALNVANFISTAENLEYGAQLSARVGGKHFVVDTGRNGNGPAPDGRWCNPSGRALGVPYTTDTGHPLADAFLWVKQPGFSDGSCNGGPGSGFHAPFALELTRNAAA